MKKIRLEDMAKMFSMEDWEKTMIEEVKMRWGNRRREIEEIERKKKEIDDKIEIRKKKKEEKRKRAIRERRCFVCGIFRHMARYCRNRGEEKRGSSMPQNKFEILKDRVMQRGERSGREVGKGRREILREEREKRKMTREAKGKPQERKIRSTTGNQQQENKLANSAGKDQQENREEIKRDCSIFILQMSYLLVVILEINSVSEIQYKKIMMIGNK